jgi:hypothetical protein
MTEVRDAADKATAAVASAFDEYEKHKNAANLRTLKYAIANMPANMTFAAKSLSEHAENVVQRARADVEAMVMHQAEQMGIEPAQLGALELTTGKEGGGES